MRETVAKLHADLELEREVTTHTLAEVSEECREATREMLYEGARKRLKEKEIPF